MKKLLYIFIAVMGAAFMTSCTGSATMVGGTMGYGYGYYDNVYYHGHPGFFRNNVIVVNNTQPNNAVVGTRSNRSSSTVAPTKTERRATRNAQVQNTRTNRSNTSVAPSRSNTNVSRSSAPARVQTRSAAPTRSSSGGTTRSARGGR